jgi:hypothetical protein
VALALVVAHSMGSDDMTETQDTKPKKETAPPAGATDLCLELASGVKAGGTTIAKLAKRRNEPVWLTRNRYNSLRSEERSFLAKLGLK